MKVVFHLVLVIVATALFDFASAAENVQAEQEETLSKRIDKRENHWPPNPPPKHPPPWHPPPKHPPPSHPPPKHPPPWHPPPKHPPPNHPPPWHPPPKHPPPPPPHCQKKLQGCNKDWDCCTKRKGVCDLVQDCGFDCSRRACLW